MNTTGVRRENKLVSVYSVVCMPCFIAAEGSKVGNNKSDQDSIYTAKRPIMSAF